MRPAGFAYHIDDRPMVLPTLQVRKIQFCRLFPPEPASQEDPKQRSIALALERVRVRHLPKRFCLGRSEPVTKANAEILRPFNAADASSEIRAEQAGIRGLVCEAPDGRESAVDRTRCQSTLPSVRLERKIGKLSPAIMSQLKEALMFALDLERASG